MQKIAGNGVYITMTSLASIHCYSWVSGGYLTNSDRDFMKWLSFIDEVLTTIDQETYNTGVFIDYLLVKIGIFLVKTIDLYRLITYNKYIKLRR